MATPDLARTINVGDPFGVEIGPDGALYVTEVRNHRVLRVDLATGELTTVAGCGRRGYSGDGGPAVAAELNEPYEVRFDGDGNMLFVEMQNHIVRRVDDKTKIITTVAGTGQKGFGGDDGPATKAQLNQPHSIALDSKGAIYIADIGNHRIRRIDPATGIIQSIAGSSQRRLPAEGQVRAEIRCWVHEHFTFTTIFCGSHYEKATAFGGWIWPTEFSIMLRGPAKRDSPAMADQQSTPPSTVPRESRWVRMAILLWPTRKITPFDISIGTPARSRPLLATGRKVLAGTVTAVRHRKQS